MDKPLKCRQKWDDMTPADGGRICSQCEKLIIDFSKSKWRDIEKRQADNNNSLCGLYSSRQLKYWGQQPPLIDINFKRPVVLSSFVLTLLSVTPSLNFSQTRVDTSINKKIRQTPIDSAAKASPNQRTILHGRVYDKQTNESMPYANVGVRGTKVWATTDSLGRYRLDISSLVDTTEAISILASYINYQIGEEVIRDKFQGSRELDFPLTSNPGIAFSVEEPKKKPFSKIRRWFRRK
jgi:hypothetical protein